MKKTFKTNKGSDLPLLNLRGKDYLEVKFRLVWFREEHPTWSIETEFLSLTEKSVFAKAMIRDDQGRLLATSHKFETNRDFPDFMEKAETGAIGRALALIGFGTQFCADELDEGKRIVDSPVGHDYGQPTQDKAYSTGLDTSEDQAQKLSGSTTDLGDFQIQFGRKYKGKRLKEIPEREIQGYLAWLEAEANKKGVAMSHDVKVLKYAVEQYHSAQSPGLTTELTSVEASESA